MSVATRRFLRKNRLVSGGGEEEEDSAGEDDERLPHGEREIYNFDDILKRSQFQ